MLFSILFESPSVGKCVMDKRDRRQKKSTRKRVWERGSFLLSSSLSLSSDIAGRCLCVIMFSYTLPCESEAKEWKDPRRRRKNGSPINGHDTAVNCLMRSCKAKWKREWKGAQQPKWPPQLPEKSLLFSLSGPVLWWWVDFFRFNSSEIGRVTDHWRGNQRPW